MLSTLDLYIKSQESLHSGQEDETIYITRNKITNMLHHVQKIDYLTWVSYELLSYSLADLYET